MKTQPLRFLRRGEWVTLPAVDTNRTLLEVLREDLHCTGTKEGCGEGDCGACTVVVAQANGAELQYSAINSCIRLAHSVDGMALWTVEDIAPRSTARAGRCPPRGPCLAWGGPALRPLPPCPTPKCPRCTPCSKPWWIAMARNAAFAHRVL